MKSTRLFPSFVTATAVALLLLGAARAEDSIVKFSDPAKPGTLKIFLSHGDLHLNGVDAAEVTVKSSAKAVTQKTRKDGLRVITSASSFSLSEKDNVAVLDARAGGWGNGSSDFRITVPRTTNIIVQSALGGEISCAGISGDLEISSINGEIRLDDIVGGAVINGTNGGIRANVRELHDGKPLSFTSLNGEVVIRVPTDAKANVRLRTQNGTVLTDFDDKTLVTKTESTPRMSKRAPKAATAGNHSAVSEQVQDAVREATRAGTAAVRQAAQAMKEASVAAREGFREGSGDGVAPTPPVPPVAATAATPPLAPMPPMPPVTGGQLVTGTLNGGGPEISVATMNGDVTLRSLEKK